MLQTHIHTHTHTCIYIYIYDHIYIYIYVYVCVVCKCMCMHISAQPFLQEAILFSPASLLLCAAKAVHARAM